MRTPTILCTHCSTIASGHSSVVWREPYLATDRILSCYWLEQSSSHPIVCWVSWLNRKAEAKFLFARIQGMNVELLMFSRR